MTTYATAVQRPLPEDPMKTLTFPVPSGMVAMGQANGHGRPVLRLDQLAPESLEIWIPVDPDIAFPPAFVAEEDPR